jgi:CBS domain containing-hemolysin-like protein
MIIGLAGIVFLFVLVVVASVQTRLELAEDQRAGALSLARALLISVLGGIWVIFAPASDRLRIVCGLLLIVIWLLQQLLGRVIGKTKLAESLTLRAEPFVTWWSRLVMPIRLVTPEAAEEYEQELLDSVEEFAETVVREVMVPRVDMEVVDSDAMLQDALSTFISTGFSRLPVVGQSVDDVVGVLYLKDLARVVHQDPALLDTKSASEASRPALFTPESKSVAELLQEMQQASTQIAVVVDEYGGVAGIVTVEDLIEELVGEIGDEYDREVVGIEKLDEVSYRVHPRTTLDEIEELCEIELEDDDVDTIGGLLVKTLGVLPKGGEQVEVSGLQLTADRVIAKKGQLSSVLVRKVVVDE